MCTLFVTLLWAPNSRAQWLDIINVTIKNELTELAGPEVVIEYDLIHDKISVNTPAYVFIRFSRDGGENWILLAEEFLRGKGKGIVTSAGHKKVYWWGREEMGLPGSDKLLVQIRAIPMVRIPAGKFKPRAVPGGGKDPSVAVESDTILGEYFIARRETTIAMYTEYLNEAGGYGAGWNQQMADSVKCGIRQEGLYPDFNYVVMPGKGKHPISYVSWYDAISFLNWCGLSLPTEAMWEKAFVGGIYLDGDASRKVLNPLPDRKYPWGNDPPGMGDLNRGNFDGVADGFERTAPVGSYPGSDSPYGVSDMAGNVAEWTSDWYTTSYHAGLDGFRMVRGGSWIALPATCDAVSGATRVPLKESNIMGFRGVKRY